jgi:hypothetical protein
MRWVHKYQNEGKITGYERTPKAYKVSNQRHIKLVKNMYIFYWNK